MEKMNKKFIDAVKNNNITYLRSFITGIMHNDPTFSTRKAERYMQYVRDHQINIEQVYQKLPGEREVPASETDFTPELYDFQVDYLQENFAYNERKPVIEKIGKVAFADKEENNVKGQPETFKAAPTERRSSRAKSSPGKIVALIAAVAAVVGLISLLIHIFQK